MNTAELERIRHTLHEYPELGNNEFRTAELIETELHKLDIPTVRLTETAVMGVLKLNGTGRTVVLRADMDALPLSEQTGVEFASRNAGVMHACGHDVHMTAVLGAAMLLSEKREQLCGEARFLFQPDEEGNGGAQRMISAGALQGCNAVCGGHVEPAYPLGTVGVRYGKFYAASDMFDITVTGRSCHGAEPENGIDALYAAAVLSSRLKHIPDAFGSEKCVVTVGKFISGTARNILAGTAELSGIMRTLGEDSRARARKLLAETARAVETETGARIDIKLMPSYPGVVNHDRETALAEETAWRLNGVRDVIRIAQPTMTTEDFGYYLMQVPGTFVHIGVGGAYPLHNPRFCPPDAACTLAANLYAGIAETYLNQP